MARKNDLVGREVKASIPMMISGVRIKRLHDDIRVIALRFDADEGVTLVDETQGRNDQDMFDTSIPDDEKVVAEKKVSTANPVLTAGEVVTTASVEVSKEPSETPTPTPIDSSQQLSKAKDKGKAKMIKPEKPKRKDQIMIDEEVARNLEAQMQAELKEEERLARQKEEKANIALIESWDNTQDMIDTDYELASRLQEEERGELTIEEKSREDLEVLWSIVKARFKKTTPVDDMDNLLFQTLKIMFEYHVQDNIWKYQQGLAKVLNWRLFYSYGVYCVTTHNMVYYLLVEKMYPFTRNISHQMWNDVRLQVDYEVEMAYDFLRLIRRKSSEGYVPE
uniref:Uncharacterized protein n=1 Tax=Tanacetum cinerariifolium TaxID=118510 RepID=A0A6L2LW46_TANCI|nr:hypothetical protein [Tanacetum cinerariifolium]